MKCTVVLDLTGLYCEFYIENHEWALSIKQDSQKDWILETGKGGFKEAT